MMPEAGRSVVLLLFGAMLVSWSAAEAQTTATIEFELEAGAVWQSRNKVQIPNDPSGSRFSLKELVGQGPWAVGRVYLTWNLNRRHGLRLLLAPFSITETGVSPVPVAFAGGVFQAEVPVEATYRFNSWRVGYRYRFLERETVSAWAGFIAKLRDAEIRLRQGEATRKDTDLGFVPLLHLATDWRFSDAGHLVFDFEGLAGGPGRAVDAALKLGHDLGDHWRVSGGYRTLEGGADVESVYNFAWFHYGVLALSYRHD